MLPSHFSKILFIIFFLLSIKSAFCENYGTLGNTFLIQEEDLLEYIENKLKTIDIEKWQNEFKEEAIKSAKKPKGVILPNATKNKIYYFDSEGQHQAFKNYNSKPNSPKDYYELNSSGEYIKTTDTEWVEGKKYYNQNYKFKH